MTDVIPTKARLVACGGAGINIAQLTHQYDLETVYIDGSDANQNEETHDANTHYIPGLRGAGSNRKLAYEKAKPHVGPLVKNFSACDFTIVLFSLAGGSGSVIGPLVVNELLTKGESVISVVLGVTDNGKGLSNTIDTLKSLEGVAAGKKAPVVISYHENQAGVQLKAIDEEMAFVIGALTELTNQNNHGLDVQDVHNWLNYHKVTPVPPMLTALSVFDNRQEATSILEPIATLSLFNDRDRANPVGNPYYTKTGFPRDPSPHMPEQLHFVTSVKLIDDYYSDLTTKQTAMNRTFGSFRNRRPIVDVDDNIGNDGMVV